jgi:sugar (pentulose or hexulose) kinase
MSNGLLDQKTKKLAEGVLRKAKLTPSWFPQVIQSGRAVGRVNTRPVGAASRAWTQVKEILAGAQVVASLGDNHATGVGCGLDEEDFQTIVVSAGTSGTVNRVCPANVSLAGRAACFEYYANRLLLMMLADCCKWYDRFVSSYAAEYADKLDELNDLILHANPNSLRRVYHDHGREIYPPDWADCTTAEQAASTQFSIVLELLFRVRAMQEEVGGQSTDMAQYVLTGGLSQSRFFQQAFHAGVKLLSPKAKVLISARKGPLRYQTAAYGALLNAMRPEDPHAGAKLCATKSAARPDAATNAYLQYLIKSQGL